MKTAILALIGLFAVSAPVAWAQEDTSPTPAATPEASRPEKSESPATDPSVSVTTEKSATPAPSKSSSPTAPKKTSSPTTKSASTPAPTKAVASPSPAASTKKMSPEATLRDLENKWETATTAHDPSVAGGLLADDYVGVNSKGKVMNRASLMSEIRKDKDTYTSAKNGKMDVRIFGGQFAVVTGTSTEIGKDKNGKAFNRTFRWTDVWVDRKGKWQCVSSQANVVAK